MKLAIKEVKNGFIVYRVGGKYKQHSHFSDYDGAATLISFIEKGKRPKSKYMIESAKRVLTKKEFNKLRIKPNYRNVNKGVKYANSGYNIKHS